MNQSPEQQIKELGETLGVNLTLDEKQQVLLLLDNEHPVSFRLHNNRWCFYAMLCYIDKESDMTGAYEKYLSMNMTEQEVGTGSICLEKQSGILLYVGSAVNHGCAQSLYQRLDTFVQRADEIRYRLSTDETPDYDSFPKGSILV